MAQSSRAHPSAGILLIALFKLLKGTLLLAVAFGALSLLHENVAREVTHWINELGVDPDNRLVHAALKKLLRVDDKKLVAISAGSFFYAGLMLTEGIGLALRKRWAEYFTIFATGSLIPLEVFELIKQISITKVVVIIVNLAILLYLILHLRTHLKEERQG